MHLRSRSLEVEVLPEVGGKIAQIRDLVDNRLWLVPPQIPYRTLVQGTDWTDYDTSGMDDCFPNVDVCRYPSPPWAGAPLPQLGEWVYGSWEVVDHASEAVTMMRTGTRLPYRTLKTVRVADHAVTVAYRVENLSDSAIEYIWSAHPLLTVGSRFELRLFSSNLSFVTYPPDGSVYQWPLYGHIDLSRDWIDRGRTLKIFLCGMTQGRCELSLDDAVIEFDCDLSPPLFLGVWFNHFGFPANDRPAFRCIAVEPCTSPTDVLGSAARQPHRTLAPRFRTDWSLQMHFRREGSPKPL